IGIYVYQDVIAHIPNSLNRIEWPFKDRICVQYFTQYLADVSIPYKSLNSNDRYGGDEDTTVLMVGLNTYAYFDSDGLIKILATNESNQQASTQIN
ncbi:MAG: hypothetical protein ACF8OB_00955, partial [Phycisphaeraceae bacterium JB051]